jgi:hypothetical protein
MLTSGFATMLIPYGTAGEHSYRTLYEHFLYASIAAHKSHAANFFLLVIEDGQHLNLEAFEFELRRIETSSLHSVIVAGAG